MSDSPSPFLTVAEVAALLKVSTTTVYRWCKSGVLDPVRLHAATHPKPGPRKRTSPRIRIRRADIEGTYPTEKKTRRQTTDPRQKAAELAELRAIGWID